MNLIINEVEKVDLSQAVYDLVQKSIDSGLIEKDILQNIIDESKYERTRR